MKRVNGLNFVWGQYFCRPMSFKRIMSFTIHNLNQNFAVIIIKHHLAVQYIKSKRPIIDHHLCFRQTQMWYSYNIIMALVFYSLQEYFNF